jgi:hypothetical protein
MVLRVVVAGALVCRARKGKAAVMPEDRADEGAAGQGLSLSRNDPVGQALVAAIHAGELETLSELLHDHPGLAAARLVDDKGGSGTPLHAAGGPVAGRARGAS